MKNQELFHGKYEFNRIGAMCPRCYYSFDIGNISINVDVNFAPDVDKAALGISPAIAVNMDSRTQFSRTFMFAVCPICKRYSIDTNMIIVDSAIMNILILLNKIGLFTEYSCDGSEDNLPYVKFLMPGDNFHELIKMISENSNLRILDNEDSEQNEYVFNYLDCSRLDRKFQHLAKIKFDVGLSAIYMKNPKWYSERSVPEFWEAIESFANLAEDAILNWKDPKESDTIDDKSLQIRRNFKQTLKLIVQNGLFNENSVNLEEMLRARIGGETL